MAVTGGSAGDLAGRTAVVTGGGQGIGRVIATALAGSGATVVVTGRHRATLEETVALVADAGGTAHAVPADVTDADQVARLAARAAALAPPVDVLVNNSGIAGPSGPLWELDPDAWDDTFAVNVRGVFLCCRAFLPGMVERGRGVVVTIGSMTAKRPLAGRTPYAASKAALIGLTRTLAHDAGPHGVRVNLISPGPVRGDRIDRVITMLAEQEGTTEDAARRSLTDPAALERLTDPADVAAAVCWLASDRAAAVTGEDLNVSGGTVMH